MAFQRHGLAMNAHSWSVVHQASNSVSGATAQPTSRKREEKKKREAAVFIWIVKQQDMSSDSTYGQKEKLEMSKAAPIKKEETALQMCTD